MVEPLDASHEHLNKCIMVVIIYASNKSLKYYDGNPRRF